MSFENLSAEPVGEIEAENKVLVIKRISRPFRNAKRVNLRFHALLTDSVQDVRFEQMAVG